MLIFYAASSKTPLQNNNKTNKLTKQKEVGAATGGGKGGCQNFRSASNSSIKFDPGIRRETIQPVLTTE